MKIFSVPSFRSFCSGVALACLTTLTFSVQANEPPGPNLLGDRDALRAATSWLLSRNVGWIIEENASPSGDDVLTYQRDDDSYALALTDVIPVIAGKRYGFRALVRGEIEPSVKIPDARLVAARLFQSELLADNADADILDTIYATVDSEVDDWFVVKGEFIPNSDCYARILFTLPKGLTGELQFSEPWVWEIEE